MNIADETARTLVLIGVTIPLFLLWIVALVDIARRSDLGIGKRLMWAAVILFGLYIGIAVYFLMRPVAEVNGKGPNPTTPETSAIVNNIEALRSSHAEGSINDTDYLARKRDLLGLT